MNTLCKSLLSGSFLAAVLVLGQGCVTDNTKSPSPQTPAPGAGHRAGPKVAYSTITIVKAASSLSASNVNNERARRLAAKKPSVKTVATDDNNVYVGEDFYLRLTTEGATISSVYCKAYVVETVWDASSGTFNLVQGALLTNTYLVNSAGYFSGSATKTLSSVPTELRIQVKDQFLIDGNKQIIFTIAKKDGSGNVLTAGSVVVNVK